MSKAPNGPSHITKAPASGNFATVTCSFQLSALSGSTRPHPATSSNCYPHTSFRLLLATNVCLRPRCRKCEAEIEQLKVPTLATTSFSPFLMLCSLFMQVCVCVCWSLYPILARKCLCSCLCLCICRQLRSYLVCSVLVLVVD